MAATETRTPTPTIEVRSIDWVPEDERHGKVWQQGPFWFLGNFQFFTIALGFTGPLVGLSLWWSFVAGALGILFGTIFMALHATQGPRLGLPQMIVGLLVASVLYFLLARARDETNEAAAIEASDRELMSLSAAEAAGHEHGIPIEEAPVPERGMPDPEEAPDEPLGGGSV